MIFFLFLLQVFASDIDKNSVKIEGVNLIYGENGAHSIPLENIATIEHEVDLIPISDNDDEETKKLIQLYNMEQKFISGKRYININGNRIEIPLQQEIEILRQKARMNKGLQAVEMSSDEKAYVGDIITKIKGLVEQDSSPITNREKTTKTVNHNVNSAAQNTTTGVLGDTSGALVIVDGLPFLLSSDDIIYSNNVFDTKTEFHTDCNLPQDPLNNGRVNVKLNRYYIDPSIISYSLTQPIDLIVDSVDSSVFCEVDEDIIFKESFEGSSPATN